MALAGGWIDQPFVSRLNPDPFGSMVVVGLEPSTRFMDRCGMATGTRNAAGRAESDATGRRAIRLDPVGPPHVPAHGILHIGEGRFWAPRA